MGIDRWPTTNSIVSGGSVDVGFLEASTVLERYELTISLLCHIVVHLLQQNHPSLIHRSMDFGPDLFHVAQDDLKVKISGKSRKNMQLGKKSVVKIS